jgi:hypothetical protein
MIDIDVFVGEDFAGNVAEVEEGGNLVWRGCLSNGTCCDWPEREQAINWTVNCFTARVNGNG